MKKAKKQRQRARRTAARKKTHRKTLAAEDKSFGIAMLVADKKGLPHMEWDGAQFSEEKPKPPPKLEVNVSIMSEAHKKFGKVWSGSRKGVFNPHTLDAYTDTCCQTCTAGIDFLEQIGCPTSYLVPTSHNIIGITSSPLEIIGSVLLRIEAGGKVSRQMVHISKNSQGLYLSERALIDLEVIPSSFPHKPASVAATSVETACCKEGVSTPCIKRTKTPDRPSEIPFAPTKENVPALEKWLLNAFGSSGFNMCTNQRLPGMVGTPMDIVLKDDAPQPRRWYTPIPVPHNWKKDVKAVLDQNVRLGVFEKVPQGDTTEECARMVVTPKANGKPRITVDYQQLNKRTVREVHHTPSPINLVSQIPAGKLKTVLDAWNGYHSMELSPEGKALTTFITEWGRYRNCRGPQGWHGTGDAYTRRFDDITADEQRYVRCIDDGCLWDDDIEAAFWHTFDHIKWCADRGIVFNREKFKFSREVVEFAGFEVTMEGYRPAPSILAAIREFPTPKNITDVRSWFGLVNQVAYSFSQSNIMEPFREALKKGRKFYWDDTLETLFQRSKNEIVQQVKAGVQAYDLQKPTCLTTDWCKTGIGFVLTQKHCKCSGPANPNCGEGHWRIVHAGSRFTRQNERDLFSPTEGECLAAVFGLEKCRMYTLGCPNLLLVVDHQPLTGILNDRSLDSIENPRLLKLKEKTLKYDFTITYTPGSSKAIQAADALSRYPASDTENVTKQEDFPSRAFAVQQARGIDSVTWEKVQEAAGIDEECVSLVNYIVGGFPSSKADLPPTLQKYWSMKDDLYVIESVPFKGRKMLIPKPLRAQVLEGLHAANQGVTGMLANARERFFWPGLDASVRQMRQQCRQCNEEAPSQSAEPLIITPPPEVPFQQTVTDLCDLEGHTFLIYADRFSGWVEVERLPTNTLRHVRKTLLKWFATYGVPEEISSDGGPPYNAHDFVSFLRTWDVRWRLSSAYYPQSNGRAEAAVKSAKRILLGNINPTTGELDTDAAARALLTHRNTPAQDTGVSPSMVLFGRHLRDHLPRFEKELRPEWGMIAESRERALAKRAIITAPSNKELTPLNVGDCVQVQNQTGNHPNKWYSTGVVAEVLPNRQYHIVLDGSRRITLRNRRFLKKVTPICRRNYDDSLVSSPPVISTQPLSEERPPLLSPVDSEELLRVENERVENERVERESLPQLSTDPTHTQPHIGSPSVSIDTLVPPSVPSVVNDTSVRRGSRVRVPRQLFSAKLKGKSHE